MGGARHRFRLASPATALVLGLFGVALVAAWGAVDLDAVRGDLTGVVQEVLEPAGVCVWISGHRRH